MTAQQSDALREIANKARVTTILQSKAWKDTQRILKRSGLVCRERSEPFDPEKHFDCRVISGEKWMDSGNQKVKQQKNRLNRSRAVCMRF